jgi:atypical dual specificity phosphatase
MDISPMTVPILSLNEFGAAFNKRVILSSINLDIPDAGITVLMGASGSGKSTLLRAISGFSSANPAYRTWGKITYLGTELTAEDNQTQEHSFRYPALVSQNIKLMVSSVLENIVDGLPERRSLTLLQQKDLAKRLLIQADLSELCDQLDTAVVDLKRADQRQLAILRQLVSNPNVLCIDEPTVGLNDAEIKRMLDYLKREAKKRAFIIVTHNQHVARALGGQTALLAGGWIQEVQATELFFSTPLTDVAKTFVATGTCAFPSPDAKPEHVADEWVDALRPLPKEAVNYKSHVLGPNSFLWLKKGRLAGTPRPGLLVDIEQDLMALKRVGITDLVSLTVNPLDSAKCQDYDINVLSSPIPDMHPPSMEQALSINQQIARLLDDNRNIAIHCRAGLGRIGTLLAAQLIYEGKSAPTALETIRNVEMRWIQSEPQVAFLEAYANFLKNEKILQKATR